MPKEKKMEGWRQWGNKGAISSCLVARIRFPRRVRWANAQPATLAVAVTACNGDIKLYLGITT